MEQIFNRWYLNKRARGDRPDVVNWFRYQKNRFHRESESIGARRRKQLPNPLAEEEAMEMNETRAD